MYNHDNSGAIQANRPLVMLLLFQVFSCVSKEIIQSTQSWPWPVKEVRYDDHNRMIFHLNREQTTRHVITEVIHQRERFGQYGTAELGSGQHVLLNPTDMTLCSRETRAVGLDDIRSMVLLQHITALLEANGFVIN